MVKPTNALQPEPLNPPEQPARTLAQEQLDFTAEGSPPPGRVACTGTTAATAAKSAVEPKDDKARNHPDHPKGAAPGRRQPPAPAGPARRASKRNPAAWGGNR